MAVLAGGATVLGEAAVFGYTATLDWHTYVAEVAQRSSQLSGLSGYNFIVVLPLVAKYLVNGGSVELGFLWASLGSGGKWLAALSAHGLWTGPSVSYT